MAECPHGATDEPATTGRLSGHHEGHDRVLRDAGGVKLRTSGSGKRWNGPKTWQCALQLFGGGCVYHQGHPARPEHDPRTSRPVLGPGGQHVGRQLLPAVPERAARASLAIGVQDPVSGTVPAILFFCCIGTFSVNNNIEDIYITAFFGVLGYIFMRLDLDPAPLMLGFILGPMLEENLRRALRLSHGSFSVFVTRPIRGTSIAIYRLT